MHLIYYIQNNCNTYCICLLRGIYLLTGIYLLRGIYLISIILLIFFYNMLIYIINNLCINIIMLNV